jgi:hypothetical protein
MRAAEPASFDAVDETIRGNHYHRVGCGPFHDRPESRRLPASGQVDGVQRHSHRSVISRRDLTAPMTDDESEGELRRHVHDRGIVG